ncbi:NAC domain-containing protein [Dionaea muscipula]
MEFTIDQKALKNSNVDLDEDQKPNIVTPQQNRVVAAAATTGKPRVQHMDPQKRNHLFQFDTYMCHPDSSSVGSGHTHSPDGSGSGSGHTHSSEITYDKEVQSEPKWNELEKALDFQFSYMDSFENDPFGAQAQAQAQVQFQDQLSPFGDMFLYLR